MMITLYDDETILPVWFGPHLNGSQEVFQNNIKKKKKGYRELS